MDVASLLDRAGIHTALVVDDGFDLAPKASDLATDLDEWTNFFEDLSADQQSQLLAMFPAYEKTRTEDLIASDEFVGALWQHRSGELKDAIRPVFERYERDNESDLGYLDALTSQLRAVGLKCETAGRDFIAKAEHVDLIVIDLFLGSAQRLDDIDRSVNGIAEISVSRGPDAPVVLLMSRSHRLEGRRADFRDRAGLFESAFRIIHKSELSKPEKLSRVLARLALHREDSKKLARFLYAWRSGIERASKAACDRIRRLDLCDVTEIQQLLLDVEGAPTGSYFVDVFDRVLQYELEGEAPIIDAALDLNTLQPSCYLPPYVDGSPDLQSLVHCALFQNPERLRLPGSDESRVAFGDVLLLKGRATNELREGDPLQHPWLTHFDRNTVFAVMSPACDLQRRGAERILLVAGELRPLGPGAWSHKDEPVRTAVMIGADREYNWIKWNLKHIETVSHADINGLLDAQRGLYIGARLREAHATELQQKLLASIGRIGLPAPLPATFPVSVDVFYPDANRRPTRLPVPELDRSGGVRIVGRSKDPSGKLVPEMRLVITEGSCEAIYGAIQELDLSLVNEGARTALEHLRDSEDLILALERGIVLPGLTATGWKEIPCPTAAPVGTGPGAKTRVIGLVANRSSLDSPPKPLPGGDISKAGILLAVADSQSHEA